MPRASPRTLARVNATDRTPADLLRSALAADPGTPLVTFYDDATGERVELSVATFANWVAKTANLLQGDLAASPATGSRCCCPRTGRRAVWLLACSSVGVVADVGGDPAAADLVVSGPRLAGRRRAPVPVSGSRSRCGRSAAASRSRRAGFADYAVEVPGQGDRFAPYAPVDPEEPALIVARGRSSRAREVVERARADAAGLGLTGPGSRAAVGLAVRHLGRA